MASSQPFNTSPFERFLDVLRTLREATGNAEMQMQTMATFAFIALRHPNEVPIGEIEKTLHMTQTSTSRNVAYLARGVVRDLPDDRSIKHGGYKLVEVFEDEFYRRRKLCKLTKKGEDLAERIATSLQYFWGATRSPTRIRAASGD